MKRHFIFLFFLFLSFAGISQDKTADSFKTVLLYAKEDSVKVKVLISQSKYYLNINPEEAKRFGMQALDLARELRFRPGYALALKSIGDAYYFLGNTPATLDYYGQSLLFFDSLGDMENKSIIFNNLGNVYFMNGTNDKALDNFFKSLEVSEKISDKPGIASAYANIGAVYKDQRATREKAIGYFLKALIMADGIGDRNTIGAVSVNLGEIYFDLNKDDSALYFFYQSLKAYENTINIPYPLRKIGEYHAKTGDYYNAILNLNRSFQMALKFDSKLDMTQTLLARGNTYSKMGDYPSALNSYKQADSIAMIIPARKELNEGYAGMAATYSKIGDYSDAYKYQKLFSNLSDTLNNQVLSEKLAALQSNFEILSRQNQINLLTQDKKLQDLELRNQKIQKSFITAALILIFIIAFGIYRNYRRKVRTNIILDKQKAEIEGLLLNILPSEVAAELQQTGIATPRFYDQVSVLFTDFKGFTLIADALSPQEVVSELNACFIAFDNIIEKYNLEKIKTIGDSYMCAGGIPTEDPDHPVNIIQAGLDIRDWMKELNRKRREAGLESWELRIGIHVGPAVAGVVGRKKYAYDIWGSTVNIASRMESSGHPGLVNISAAAYELVKHRYSCVYRGKVMAKNIGEIDMYFVEKEIA